MLQSECSLTKIGFDTAENRASPPTENEQTWQKPSANVGKAATTVALEGAGPELARPRPRRSTSAARQASAGRREPTHAQVSPPAVHIIPLVPVSFVKLWSDFQIASKARLKRRETFKESQPTTRPILSQAVAARAHLESACPSMRQDSPTCSKEKCVQNIAPEPENTLKRKNDFPNY